MSSYQWFIAPLDTDTNQAISDTWPTLEYGDVYCSDGVRRGMWLMDGHEQVSRLCDCREQRKLRFSVYNRSRPNNPAREWKFEKNYRNKRARKNGAPVEVPF